MAITKVPARDFTFEIDTTGAGNWVLINGIDTLTRAPNTVRADTRTFEDGTRHRHWVASRGDQFTLAGMRLEDSVTGDRDPGQEAVETLATQYGPNSIMPFRITSPGGNVLTFNASAEATQFGGGKDDPAAWQAVIEVDGDIVAT